VALSRDVEFTVDQDVLVGTLSLPGGPDRRAGVVFLHGSGPASRAAWNDDVRILVERGIAALAYDKPANWTSQSFEDRAEEALIALGVLQTQPEVDKRVVGLLGGSQGGWIAPMAAAQSSEVAFAIVASASGVGPREQDLYRIEHQLEAEGFPSEQIDAALAAWHERDQRIRRGESLEAILAATRRYRDEPWYGYVAFDEPGVLDFVRRIYEFDVVPYLERCQCPLLAVWGAADSIVPVEESQRIFERALEKAGNALCEFIVVPGADHGLRGGEIERGEVIGLIADWILREANR
jgi:pimeloyl-ACP methyl ester carboxylesterase